MGMKKAFKQTLRIILLSILIGGASGIFASALTNNYLREYALELTDLTAPLEFTQERPRAFPKSFADAQEGVKEKVPPTIVEVFNPQYTQVPNFLSENAIARGVLLSSDGWMVINTPNRTLTGTPLLVHKEVVEIEKSLSDFTTGITFVKTDQDNLPVLAFGESRNIEIGEQVFVFSSSDEMVTRRVRSISFGEAKSQKSEIPLRRIVLDGEVNAAKGAIVVNLSGEILGLIESSTNDQTIVLPIDSILPLFNSLLKEEEIVRPRLGVSTIDLAHHRGLSEELTKGRRAGALVYGYGGIQYNSPAANAGIQLGDIILAIDGQPLTGHITLGEYVMDAQVEQEMYLRILRNEEEIELTVVIDRLF